MARADAALYRAKEKGRDAFEVDVSAEELEAAAERVGSGFLHLVWNSAYDSGHPLIDAQHRKLVELGNALLDAVVGSRPRDDVGALIARLQAAVIAHFKDEEAIFRAARYPGADKHAQLHRALLERTGELASAFAGKTLAPNDVLGFLVYDLVAKHLLLEDRKFFPYLESQGTPADAVSV